VAHKLLLADDSVTIQRVIELTFADEDVQVVAVGDGQQAIDRLSAERPDIVLADIGMPQRDGYEVAAFIRNHAEFSHIPVLLLTGAFEPIDEGRAREVGCDGVLVKPFEPQMVISRVKELLSGKRPPKAPSTAASASDSQPTSGEPAADTLRAATMNPRPGGEQTGEGGGSIEDYFDRLDAAFGDGSASQSGPPAVSPTDKTQPIPIPSLGDELASWDPDLSMSPSSSSDTVLSLDDLKDDVVPDTRPSADASTPGQAPQTFSFAAATPVAPLTPPPSEAEPPRSLGFSAAAPIAPPIPAPAPSHIPPPAIPPPAAASAPTAASSPRTPVPAPSLAQAFATLLATEQGKVGPLAHGAQPVTEDVIDQVTRRVIEQLGDRSVRDIVLEVAERLVREEIERIKANAR
jgi:CheY-like chemotaxis protein